MDYYNKYFEGIFWIPDNEDKKIISTLYIDDKGIATITSLQSFEPETSVLHGNKNLALVLGYLNCHDESKTYSIKLYDVYKNYQLTGSLNKFKYTSNLAIITPSFDRNINDRTYNTIMLNSDLINNWVPFTGFNFKTDIEDSFEINHLYKQPDIINLFKNKDFDIYIFFRASSNFKGRRSSSINESVFINIKTAESFEIKSSKNIIASIEHLFNLILFTPFYSNSIELRTTDSINYKLLKRRNKLETNITQKINFKFFKDNSQKIFSKWFEKQVKLELAILNFFSVYGNNEVFVENKFLTYISILENYHKNNIKKDDCLKTRLNYLLKNSCISHNINDIDKFSETLKITRNYHTHLEEKHKEKSLNSLEIHQANYLLEFIIREIFLGEVGIKEPLKIPSNVEKYLVKI
ncbi:ApeA N-terminal domain 1-containing protein [Aestuariibaculum lutulentum]|uniref:ApeA N-terminal domain-containing protein n=1 Tax=Aestuariibaculum lutulentum TaxID=2920935 RepID=A0ABS9RHY0_9FLAO|nr:HEPN domain-containing protein [Aestuariibaculum lutulentum]MCH4552548.1 hypothetical protein [Aestuariibaculum lutulentum]